MNISVAVQTENGLYVPVVQVSWLFYDDESYYAFASNNSLSHITFNLQDADKKGLSRIAEEVKQLAQKANEGRLKPEDYEVRRIFCMKSLLAIGIQKL